MKLVVDANILFSAVLSKDGLVAETFHEAPSAFTLIAPAYIAGELVRLRPNAWFASSTITVSNGADPAICAAHIAYTESG